MLFVNADDLGWNKETTNRIITCCQHERIHSASLMTLMNDSERAVDLAQTNGLGVGLHLNFIQELTSDSVDATLTDQHCRLTAYLKAWKVNQILFNPLLIRDFDYVFQAQWDEFCRLYGEEPKRLDGHHHMHLCMNMIFSGKYPKGIRIRRNFSFRPGEKDPINRFYRYLVDCWLTSRFQCTDYFFSMEPINQNRIERLVSLSKHSDVEIMVHPGVDEEYRYLMTDEWAKLLSRSKTNTTGSGLHS